MPNKRVPLLADNKGISPVIAAALLIALMVTSVGVAYVFLIPQIQRLQIKQNEANIITGLQSLGTAALDVAVGKANESRYVRFTTDTGVEVRSFDNSVVQQGVVINYQDAGGTPQTLTLIPLSNMPVLVVFQSPTENSPIQNNRHRIMTDPDPPGYETFFVSSQAGTDLGRIILNLTRPVLGISGSAGYVLMFRISITSNIWVDSGGNTHLQLTLNRIVLSFPTPIQESDGDYQFKILHSRTTISQTSVTASGQTSITGTTDTDGGADFTETPWLLTPTGGTYILDVQLVTTQVIIQSV